VEILKNFQNASLAYLLIDAYIYALLPAFLPRKRVLSAEWKNCWLAAQHVCCACHQLLTSRYCWCRLHYFGWRMYSKRVGIIIIMGVFRKGDFL